MTLFNFEYTGNNTWNMTGATPLTTGVMTVNQSGFYAVITIDGVTKNYNMNPYIRYRKLYNDYTFSKAANNCATLNPVNTCREPSAGFCGNTSGIQLNVPTYNVSNCDKCSCAGGGRPVDIDVGCMSDGTLKYRPTPQDLNYPSSTFLVFAASGNPVPVINNILYDTTTAQPGTNYILHTASSIDDIRNWVCSNLRFVDIVDPTLLSTKPCCAIKSNWPFNDLYSNSSGAVIAVPC